MSDLRSILLFATPPWLYSHYRIGPGLPSPILSSGVSCLELDLSLLSSFKSYLVFKKSTHPLVCVDFAVCTGTTTTPLAKISLILNAWIRITRPGVCFTASLPTSLRRITNRSATTSFLPAGFALLLLPPLWLCPPYKAQLFVHQELSRNSLL
jgi:hypothetical protein